jgi:hypothetical protein
MMSVLPLGDLSKEIGNEVSLLALIQQVSTGKRLIIGKNRVSPCNILLLADPTKSFFKLTCWGYIPVYQQLESDQMDGSTPLAGDIVVISKYVALYTWMLAHIENMLYCRCLVKSYKGNIETQLTQNSSLQLMYRRDRYFNTNNIRLPQLFPIITWYKENFRDIFLMNDQLVRQVRASSIAELRENMIAHITCKLKKDPHKSSNIPTTSTTNSECDGVLLYELLMVDKNGDVMCLNLWDQFAERTFVSRLQIDPYSSTMYEITHLVVRLNIETNRLIANTTSLTKFCQIEDPNCHFSEGSDTPSKSLEDVENSMVSRVFLIENVCVEKILFEEDMGAPFEVLPRHVSLLVECCCNNCENVLPHLDITVVPPLYRNCMTCKTKKRKEEDIPKQDRIWRYKTIHMLLRDTFDYQLVVEVGNQAMVGILGMIEAEQLVNPHQNGKLPFDVSYTVANLLHALVMDGRQHFCAKIQCRAEQTNFSQGSLQDISLLKRFILETLEIHIT